ncbi:hypothetical protein V6N12_009451 [Hibiscus sabdariffa]|uniref:Uncharacterized protein n=1 Tax=Hibiscus sabdariffa TaxID=183260 RepID=A0ABR2E9L3_9ROSI
MGVGKCGEGLILGSRMGMVASSRFLMKGPVGARSLGGMMGGELDGDGSSGGVRLRSVCDIRMVNEVEVSDGGGGFSRDRCGGG